MQAVYDEWMEELEINAGTGHCRNYKGYWKNLISPMIAHVKVGALNEQHLQSVINSAHKKGLSLKTLSEVRGCMTSIVKFARKNKYTTLIVENVTLPRNAPVGERTILQPEDLKILFSNDKAIINSALRKEPYINAFRFEVLTGMRPGEIFGLQWADISNGVVSIKRSINSDYEETHGKNKNAVREFVLTELSQSVLDDQRAELLKAGMISKFVFPDKYGDAIHTRTYYKHWVRYRDYVGISTATPYELRHTFVSIVKPLPVGLVKAVVGHSVAMDTYGTYGHEVDGEKIETANLIQAQFKKILP
jgi:integrase